MREPRCPLCHSEATHFLHPLSDTGLRLPFANQRCSKCELPCRLWQELAEQQVATDRLMSMLRKEVISFGFRGEYMEPIRMCRLCQECWPTKSKPQHNKECVLFVDNDEGTGGRGGENVMSDILDELTEK